MGCAGSAMSGGGISRTSPSSGRAFNRHSSLIMRSPGAIKGTPGEGGQPIPDDLDHELESIPLELSPTMDHEPKETHHLVQADASPEATFHIGSMAPLLRVCGHEPGAHALGLRPPVQRARPRGLA